MEQHTHPTNGNTQLLQVWCEAMIAFGLAIALIPWVRDDFFAWIATGDADHARDWPQAARDYVTFNQALLGALTAGLGLAAFWLARVPIARGEAWAWTAFVTSVGLWFVVDNIASIALGFPRNVVFNVVLVAPAVPLLWTARRAIPATTSPDRLPV